MINRAGHYIGSMTITLMESRLMAARVGVADKCRDRWFSSREDCLCREPIGNREERRSTIGKSLIRANVNLETAKTTRLVDCEPCGRSRRKESNFGSSAGSSPEDRFAWNFWQIALRFRVSKWRNLRAIRKGHVASGAGMRDAPTTAM